VSQASLILGMLWRAGPRGVCTRELLERRMPRYAARIHDLRRRGHAIITMDCDDLDHGHRTRQVRYVFTPPGPPILPAGALAVRLSQP